MSRMSKTLRYPMVRGYQHEVFEDRHGLDFAGYLKRSYYSLTEDLMGRKALDSLSIE